MRNCGVNILLCCFEILGGVTCDGQGSLLCEDRNRDVGYSVLCLLEQETFLVKLLHEKQRPPQYDRSLAVCTLRAHKLKVSSFHALWRVDLVFKRTLSALLHARGVTTAMLISDVCSNSCPY